jgi:hypothetical protein
VKQRERQKFKVERDGIAPFVASQGKRVNLRTFASLSASKTWS